MIGIFQAKIKDYGASQSKAGNVQVFIKFNFKTDNLEKELTWYGSFVGGAKDITLKTLIYCGLQPQNYGQLVQLNHGVASNMLDLNKVLNIDVQEEPKQDGSGVRTVVQWVNDPAIAPAVKKVDEAKNNQFFGSMGFDRDLSRLAGDLGLSGGGQNQNQNQNMNYNGQQNVQTMGQNQTTTQPVNNNQNNFQQNPPANNGQQNFQQNPPANNNGQQNFNQGQGQNNAQGFQAPF